MTSIPEGHDFDAKTSRAGRNNELPCRIQLCGKYHGITGSIGARRLPAWGDKAPDVHLSYTHSTHYSVHVSAASLGNSTRIWLLAQHRSSPETPRLIISVRVNRNPSATDVTKALVLLLIPVQVQNRL
jgi:hypothetical protein